MKNYLRIALAASLVAMAIACDKTGPSDETATFTAQLSPANELHVVTGGEASGTGNVTIVFRINRDSGGAIISATANFQVAMSGFPNGVRLSMAHIHRGAVGTNGPIVVDTGLTLDEVILGNGSGAFTKTGIAVSASLAQEILSGPAGFYFNVHSFVNAPGIARGQLVRQ